MKKKYGVSMEDLIDMGPTTWTRSILNQKQPLPGQISVKVGISK